jgi:predicted transcriptional regulator
MEILTKDEKKTYMPVKEYADKAGYTVQRIYQLLKEGKLKGKKIGSYQLVKV